MRPVVSRFLSIVLCLSLVFQISCSKEKAEAVKATANAFNVQAQAALDKLEGLFKESASFTPEMKEDVIEGIVVNLKGDRFGEEEIRQILKESKIEDLDPSDYNQKIEEIRITYREFAAMYTNLPQGNLFAGDAVERSEKVAVKLTVQMYSLGQHIEKYPFVSSSRLQAIRRKRDLIKMNETRPEVLDVKMRAVAEDIYSLRIETDKANRDAIAECAKGAVLGLQVAKLIRDYKKFSVNDVLQIMKETLPAVSQLTGQNTESLLGKLNNIQSAVKSDPKWAQLAVQIEAEVARQRTKL